MAKEQERIITAADLERAQQEAAAAERARVAAVSKVLAGHPEQLEKALADGNCDEQAAKALLGESLAGRMAELEKQIAARDATIAELQGRLDTIAAGGGSAAADEPGDVEDEPRVPAVKAGDDGQAGTYAAAVQKHLDAGKSRAQAHQAAQRQFPRSHRAWVESQ